MKQPVKVLIVEDSEDDAKLAMRALRQGGFEPTHRRVQTAADLETALAHESWDAVISDFMMPSFTGVEALGIFRATGLDIPFILVSGTIGEETAVTAMKAGASDYVMKDNLSRLAPALEREIKETAMRGEHRQAQRDLVQSELRLRTIIETEPECVKVVSQTGVLLEMNAAGLAMLEADSLAAVQSRTLLHFIVPEYRAAFAALHKRVICGESGMLEFEVIGLKGGRRWLETHAAPLRGANGSGAMLLGVTRDVTERKRAELASIRLAAIVESSEDAIIGKDLSSIVTSWNKGAENIFGYTAGEMVGTSILRLIPADRREEESQILELIKHGESAEHFDTLRQTKDGRLIDVSVTTSPIKDAAGKVIGVSKLARDITERKHAERQLQESEAKYRHLIEQADDGIFISDAQGIYVLANSRCLELLGYTEDELVGINSNLTYPEEERDNHAKRMQAVSTGRALRFERMVKRKDGSLFPAEISLKKLDNGMVQVIFHDITQRRSQDQKISRLSRIHAVLSGINAAIVRIRDRRELFQEACRIIVEHGHFILGWIAVLDHATGKLTAVAQAGLHASAVEDSYLFDGSVALAAGGTAEVALREKRAAVNNAIENASGPIPEQEQDTLKVRRAAIKLGAKSVIVLPLVVEGETFGILTLYAPDRNFFDDEEVKLLNDLAGDISFGLEFIAKDEKVNYLAYYDALTGLANRSLFLERVTQQMRSALSGGHKLALFLFDLERFKNINDSLGRPAGDALLRQVAEWLTRNAGDAILVARVGADHFAMVLPDVTQESEVARVLEATMDSFLDHPFHLIDSIFRIAAKAGVALFPNDGTDADTLFRNAEAALKNAKASGDRYLFYTQRMTATVAGKLTLENQLRQALDNEEFVLHYQPKVNLESGKLTSAEALIRWNDPRTGLVPPGRFIPILEETGLIYEVGRWALRKAIAEYLRWRSAGLPAVRIAVNVSPLQLRNRGFIAEIKQAIGIDAQAAAGLELEITESLIMEDVKHSIASLQAIRAMGVRIAIDDFGTGFSSLSYLAKLPVDTLKIDRSFVIDMTAAQEGLALVSTIISLAHSLKLNVVAEGVETEEQSRLLRLLACDEMQGYLFSRPVPREIFETRFLAPRPSE